MAEFADYKNGKVYYGKFPDGFMWSCATASYQIEGAYNEDGKGQNIWDTFSHTPGKVLNGDTGDIACDSYHRYEEDIQNLKKLGVTNYRFSISWSRILPDGTVSNINEKGIAYYNKLIDGLLAAGIQPCVTLYHWDLPQALQDIGGWHDNPEIATLFGKYADLCYSRFGDRVKLWITINEPSVVTWLGYGDGAHAPGIKDPLGATFRTAHNLIRAHGQAYKQYEKYRQAQKGRIAITLNSDWNEPKDPSNPSDKMASHILQELKLGLFANPIYGNGDYPDLLKQACKKLGEKLGIPNPLLEFTKEEIDLQKGSADFFGLNHYSTRIASMLPPSQIPDKVEGHDIGKLFGAAEDVDPSWTRGKSVWLYAVPWGLRMLLRWIKATYNNPPVFITENGFSDDGNLDDQGRVEYYKGYIDEVLKAQALDGCNVIGYTAWSLMDNYEWSMGYSEHFGLYQVDFNDPKRKRTPKTSASVYADIVKNNGIV